MNNVKMILEKYGKDTIWFYLKDGKTEESFKKELMELGATWMSGEKLEEHHSLSYYIAVHSDKTIAFISSMCWRMSFVTNEEIVHVNYSLLKE